MGTVLSPASDSSIPSRAPRLHLDFLDGLRAIAALMVVVNHLWGVYTHHVPRKGITGFFTNWLENGHLWVNVFIVLSGFCLMLPVARTRMLRGGWQTFYKSRARRILPPLYAAIGLAIVKSLLEHKHIPHETILVNVFLLQDIFQNRGTLDFPLWSVAVEWKIYFLFPLFVWLWLRFGPPAVLLASAVLSAVVLSLYMASHLIQHEIYAAPWYIFLFALGMVSADFARRSELPAKAYPAAWLILGVALVLDWAQAYFWHIVSRDSLLWILHTPVNDALTGLVVSALLFLLTRTATSETNSPILTLLWSVLSWRPLVFIGTFAYSIYLIHVLVIYAIQTQLVSHLHTSAPYVIFPLIMAILIPIAYLFHLAFERPFMSNPRTTIKTERQAEVAAVVNPAP